MVVCFRASSLLLLSALCLSSWGAAGQEEDATLLWSSTGGGWRAMFADVGYANVFQQAGILTPTSSAFSQVSTVSGGSWFSTQLFYSEAFYNQTVLAKSPEEIEQFVLDWMAIYLDMSTEVGNDDISTCNASEIKENGNIDPENDFVANMEDICELLVAYNFDWAYFIQQMLNMTATNFGDPNFVDTIASPANRIPPMSQSDLLIQAALVPTSRLRDSNPESSTTTAVYLGTNPASKAEKLFTVPLSAAFIVEDTGGGFVYGTEDLTPTIETYTGTTPAEHKWSTWEPWGYFPGDVGSVEIDNTPDAINNPDQPVHQGSFRVPYGGPESTTVLQIAAISSAAGGNGSPLAPSVYSQTFSIGWIKIEEYSVDTIFRVLVGIAAGLGAGFLFGFLVSYFGFKWRLCAEESSSKNWGIVVCIAVGCLVGILTGVLYGVGSVFLTNGYDWGIDGIYQNPQFDKFAICSQWPNDCGNLDGQFIDGWFIDNPALVINVGHYQQKNPVSDKPLKVIITNCNESWNNTFNYAQILQYWATDFNVDVPPGGFLWAPGYWAPFRSPQIFSEFLGERGIDALLEPIPDSNMTTALLKGTTLDNPSFGTKAGQPVEMLLLNLNENITTFVIGPEAVGQYTQPLADMAAHVAGSQELVRRVREFAGITPASPEDEATPQASDATSEQLQEPDSTNATETEGSAIAEEIMEPESTNVAETEEDESTNATQT